MEIAQIFLMPSFLILLFLVIGIIFVLRDSRSKWGRVFVFLGVLFYYLFSISFVSDSLLAPLEEKYQPLSLEEINSVSTAVLLLGGRESDVLRGNEILRLWHLSKEEMNVIISGTDPIFYANGKHEVIRNFFIHRGINSQNIVIEGKSSNTRENVANVYEIVKDEPFFLVTSAYHMHRAEKEFERLGANPITAPTDFKSKRTSGYGINDFIPRGRNLRNSDLAVHEYLGEIYYRF